METFAAGPVEGGKKQIQNDKHVGRSQHCPAAACSAKDKLFWILKWLHNIPADHTEKKGADSARYSLKAGDAGSLAQCTRAPPPSPEKKLSN